MSQVVAGGGRHQGAEDGGRLGGVKRLLRQLTPRPPPQRMRKVLAKLGRLKPLLPVFVALVLLVMQASRRAAAAPRPIEVPFSAFMSAAAKDASSISGLRMSLSRFSFLLDGQPAFTRPVRAQYELLSFLHKAGVEFRASAGSSAAGLIQLLFPIIWLAALFSAMRRQLGGATGSVAKKASVLRLSPDELSFEDVAGVDTAKGEVREVVSMLREPGRYAASGARLPAGVLMVGPPGTGKTLLARVMAAQAGVPFFYCSGSDFVELFVGRGAARMRALFKEAAAVAPCIIFVDELDALGKMRSMRLGSSNDEVEQTLNQMLACMDGLDSNDNGVIVMGATNRYEILDPALTRPGRFDRIVRIPLPDEAGRTAILRVHARKLKLDQDVRLQLVAASTPMLSGAELAALTNEAAIRAVRRESDTVNMADFKGATEAFISSRSRAMVGNSLLGKLLPGP